MGYEFVTYRPELKEGICALQAHLWRARPPVNLAYFEWKYESNPYTDGPVIHIALHEGVVVGMRGAFGARWKDGDGHMIDIPCAGDTVVDPAHRRRGLVTELTHRFLADLAARRIRYVLNLSAAEITYRHYLKMGWRTAGPLDQWSSPPGYAASPERSTRVFIKETARPEAMAALVARARLDGRVRHVRDEEYFAWRFTNPRRHYRFLFYGDDESLEGYLVLQTWGVNSKVVNVVDWCAPDAAIAAELFEAAAHEERQRRLLIHSSPLGSAVKTTLERAGFKDEAMPRGEACELPAVLVRAVDDSLPIAKWTLSGRPILNLESWQIRTIDSDAG